MSTYLNHLMYIFTYIYIGTLIIHSILHTMTFSNVVCNVRQKLIQPTVFLNGKIMKLLY